MEALIALLGGIALFFLILAYSAISWGCVVYSFYNWFLLPVFVELPTITWIQAIGLSMFISLFKNHGSSKYKGDHPKKEIDWGMFILQPWAVMFIGWIIYCFSK